MKAIRKFPIIISSVLTAGLLIAGCESGTTASPTATSTPIPAISSGAVTRVTSGAPTPTPTAGAVNVDWGNRLALQWMRQFGSSGSDSANVVVTDDQGSIFIAGQTTGSLAGLRLSGARDIFIRKYDAAGQEQWTRLFGTPGVDIASVLLPDSGGNLYVGGSIAGSLPGQTSKGGADSFVRKYDSRGVELWTIQWGGEGDDGVTALTLDSEGSLYIAGPMIGFFPDQTSRHGNTDTQVRKLDPHRNFVWTKQFGTLRDEYVKTVSRDGQGNIYIAGWTTGLLEDEPQPGATSIFARKLDSKGDLVWAHLFGAPGSNEVAEAVADAAGNLYVAGGTDAALPGQAALGGDDAFLIKIAPTGTIAWTRQFGTGAFDSATALSMDVAGRIYVAGYTTGQFPGQAKVGQPDGFLSAYAADGSDLWMRQFSAGDGGQPAALANDRSGALVLAGSTDGKLPGQTSAGSIDVVLMKLLPK